MLLPHHQALLESSGIADEVAEKRSYFSATTGAALRGLGFGRSQLAVPALVIPLHDAAGEPFGYQARPDEPREIRGKRVKYETPARQPNRIDVPPCCVDALGDPSVPVIVTEGSRKADSAASRGMCAVSINGVYGWRGTNGNGGKTVLPDFGLLALNGRRVVLCFDSDAMTKPDVHRALAGLAAFLEMRHAEVSFCYLPPSPSGAKTGLDDWLVGDMSRGFAELEALCRPKLDDLDPAGREDTFDDVEEESGVLLLNDVRSELRRYLVLPSVAAETAITLWIAHSHTFDADDVSPNLFLRSPMKGSGKTRTLEVSELLVRKPRRAVNISSAALFRLVAQEQPTILLDEVDMFLGGRRGDPSKDEMISLLNSSFRRGESAVRVAGERSDMAPKEFILYTPLLLAGLGKLPEMLQHRSIVVTLQRKPPGVKVAPFRRREAVGTLAPLQRRLAAWAKRHMQEVGDARPAMPESVADRAADKWEPLMAVAQVAGGPWPKLASDAAVAFTSDEVADDADDSLPMRLLLDLAKVWPTRAEEWPSTDVVTALKVLSDAPWIEMGKSGISVRRLAGMLRPFRIIPQRSSDHRGPMKYQLSQVVPVWVQYGVPVPDWCACQVPNPVPDPAQAAHPAQTPSDQGKDCAGLENPILRKPAQGEAPGDDAQDGAGWENSILRNETAGQAPFAQDTQLAQDGEGDTEPDMHVGEPSEPPDTMSIDGVLGDYWQGEP